MLTFQQLQERMIKFTGPLGGNPGGMVDIINKKTGEKSLGYVKHYRNNDQYMTEIAALRVYKLFGLDTFKASVVKVQGKTGLVSHWRDDISDSHWYENDLTEDQKLQLAKAYLASVLVRNWDTKFSNLSRTNSGDFVVGDTGGSFHFRALGEIKPDKFPVQNVSELTTFLNKRFPAGRLFADTITRNPQLLKKAKDVLEGISDDELAGVFKGLVFSSAKVKQMLENNLVERKYVILKKLEGITHEN